MSSVRACVTQHLGAGAVVSFDVSHVDDPGPFILANSALDNGWIAAEVKVRKGGIHGEARHDVADEGVVATIEILSRRTGLGPSPAPPTEPITSQ